MSCQTHTYYIIHPIRTTRIRVSRRMLSVTARILAIRSCWGRAPLRLIAAINRNETCSLRLAGTCFRKVMNHINSKTKTLRHPLYWTGTLIRDDEMWIILCPHSRRPFCIALIHQLQHGEKAGDTDDLCCEIWFLDYGSFVRRSAELGVLLLVPRQ